MAKSRITRKEANELYESKKTVAQFRDLADAGDEEARKIVAAARENVARLTAKRDNRIWL
jgi:predicted NBD/HSP70 family sugar kinase